MQVSVTCVEELEDIDGAFLGERYHQDEAHAEQARYFPRRSTICSSLLYDS